MKSVPNSHEQGAEAEPISQSERDPFTMFPAAEGILTPELVRKIEEEETEPGGFA